MITVVSQDGSKSQIGGRRVDPSSILNVAQVEAFVMPREQVSQHAARISVVGAGQPVAVVGMMIANASHQIHTPNTATGHEIRQRIRKAIRKEVTC